MSFAPAYYWHASVTLYFGLYWTQKLQYYKFIDQFYGSIYVVVERKRQFKSLCEKTREFA